MVRCPSHFNDEPAVAPTGLAPTCLSSTLIREGTGWREVGCPDVKRSSPGTPPPANPAPHPYKPRAAAHAAGANTNHGGEPDNVGTGPSRQAQTA
ncbi:hypothetical protein GCM10009864_46270 [Streptomyces lunalinharesii]|uniref:Uncharacterized protein n=1 Tax=Streptomyces lunalinharesii TaxID=333384 RepID=A0ABP6EMP5_9ACTN